MKEQEIKACLLAHHAALIALVRCAKQAQFLHYFGPAISDAIDAEPDPRVQGLMRVYEEEFRKLPGT